MKIFIFASALSLVGSCATERYSDRIQNLKDGIVFNNKEQINTYANTITANEIKDENVVELFNVSRQRILSMAKLHEKMYGSEDLQHINIHEHFESLIKGLLDSYATDKEITLDLKTENVNLEIDTLIPLGLMINEIITNSLKYAFINQNQGIITLHLRSINHQEYEMIIGDNGTGITLKDVSDGFICLHKCTQNVLHLHKNECSSNINCLTRIPGSHNYSLLIPCI